LLVVNLNWGARVEELVSQKKCVACPQVDILFTPREIKNYLTFNSEVFLSPLSLLTLSSFELISTYLSLFCKSEFRLRWKKQYFSNCFFRVFKWFFVDFFYFTSVYWKVLMVFWKFFLVFIRFFAVSWGFLWWCHLAETSSRLLESSSHLLEYNSKKPQKLKLSLRTLKNL
jgi:hypothetical protein